MQKSLYIPEFEKDACGVGCVVNVNDNKSHTIIQEALLMLKNMDHRGATGADSNTGDGAGILVQIPHDFFKIELQKQNVHLPNKGEYSVGMIFFPQNPNQIEKCKNIINICLQKMHFKLLVYRKVPVVKTILGHEAKSVEPYIEQIFLQHEDSKISNEDLERKMYILNSFIENEIREKSNHQIQDFHLVSTSARTIIYKGQLKTDQIESYYTDLSNPEFKSSLAIVHSRFSTNTFPNWKLAQPFTHLAHNGEINTIRGNVIKMKSKEAHLKSPYFTDEEIQFLTPITNPNISDSANLDAIISLLTLSGRSIAHSMMMLVPEAWQHNFSMDAEKRDFYRYHAALMEPWDGPAALFFTNGIQIGATLDRNGLRPIRYCLTAEDKLIMASETGTIPVQEEQIVEKGRLGPGKMLLVDLQQKKVLKDDEIKKPLYKNKPYGEWIKNNRIRLKDLEIKAPKKRIINAETLLKRQISNGISEEDIKMIILPIAEEANEPIGSMGADIPLAVLSRQSQHISNYFKQYFAQVSNPAIDPIRERLVMSLFTRLGRSLNILDETSEHIRQVHISQPILSRHDFYKIKALENKGFNHQFIDATFKKTEGKTLKQAIERISKQALEATHNGVQILIISNKKEDAQKTPIPSLLAIGGVHHYLVKHEVRTEVGLIVEASDAWETHHFATIIGYGASAVYPYLTYDIIQDFYEKQQLDNTKTLDHYIDNYIYGIGKGLLKILSKMGISTLQSYQASQIFECVGLGEDIIETCFKSTISRLGGLSFKEVEAENYARHQLAYDLDEQYLQTSGIYQWKRVGEKHLLNPKTIHLLQKSTKLNDYKLFKEFTSSINAESGGGIINLRDLFEFKNKLEIPIEEVEPKESIFKRFATGAMSFGSLSHEAHTTLAIAMNRIGAKSNSGEGGEDPIRYVKKANGDWECSAIKQVASGRFGVTIEYLTSANELQIKIAQGAKPGEGGQLPGHKVDEWIARVRHSTPGVGLISPPPHHDIYSIEDLKQLIFDLKNANPDARINVKLVAEAGVGTIAAGVAKAKADVILIAGADGGTGASPLSSIRHTGLPWEIGLAETHQTLVKNNLRSKIVLQTDGKIMTGRDLAIATLLGAEEYGVSTAALIVEGCIMMRKCHLNTCPVGVATQNPELRKLFTGDPQHVVNFFHMLVEEFREHMAMLGFRTVNEMVGQAQVLKRKNNLNHWKADTLDLDSVLHKTTAPTYHGLYNQEKQDHNITKVLDKKLIEIVKSQNFDSKKCIAIKNTDRSTGAMLSNYLTKNNIDLEAQPLTFRFKGSAGQSFGAFLKKNVHFFLEGEANDYVAKGLSGGRLVIMKSTEGHFKANENIIIGNVAMYGATSGEVFINGQAGERFAVRNSGAEVIVEGIGEHGCEYMTGGIAIILGQVGKNFAAGMSGGMAFIYKQQDDLDTVCNMEMVEFEPLEKEDVEIVYSKIQKHIELTQSEIASNILNNWEKEKLAFIKVMPKEFKKVLTLRKLNKKVS